MAQVPLCWIALVIGNSRLHWAWGTGAEVQQCWHTSHLAPEAIARLVRQDFDFTSIDEACPNGAKRFKERDLYIASVVPAQTAQWVTYCPRATCFTLADLPLKDGYPTLGIDRALAVCGAVARYHRPVLVIDAGTALTVTGVDAEFRLIGGAIVPGVRLQFQSLGVYTADLPLVTLDSVAKVGYPPRWAMQTETAILSGVLHMLTSGVRDFIQDWGDRYPDTTLVLTGGDRRLIWTELESVDPALAHRVQVSDTAVMEGMAIAIAQRLSC